jgi:hypothetical protein
MGEVRELHAGSGRLSRFALAAAVVFALSAVPGAVARPTGSPGSPSHAPAFTATTTGATASFTIGCPPSPLGAIRAYCVGGITLSAHKLRTGHSFILVSSGNPRTTNVVVGRGRYVVAGGSTVTIAVGLNRLGRHLLGRFYKLPATATAIGSVGATIPVKFAYGLVGSSFLWTWTFTPHYTRLLQMEVVGIPTDGSVLIVCHGGGCPFARRTVLASSSRISLTSQLDAARLRPGSTLWVAVHAPNDVGKVALFRIISGQTPREAIECLPPGDSAPQRCATPARRPPAAPPADRRAGVRAGALELLSLPGLTSPANRNSAAAQLE